MSNTKVETLQCCVPVLDPDTLSNERERGTTAIMKSRRKTLLMPSRLHVRVQLIAAFKPSASLLLKAALREITLRFYLYGAP